MEAIADLHPIIVHFPIALLVVYSLFEISGVLLNKDDLSKIALYLLFLGVITSIGAVLTGNQAADAASELIKNGAEIPQELIDTHEEYANFTMWFYTAILVARVYLVLKKKFTRKIKYLFAVLSLAGCFLIYETAEHGGELVYKYGAGTELIKKKGSDN